MEYWDIGRHADQTEVDGEGNVFFTAETTQTENRGREERQKDSNM